MRVDETSTPPQEPERFEAIATTGGRPIFPPTDESIKDLGPLTDTPTAPDAPGVAEAARANGEAITEGKSLSPLQASLRRLTRDRRAMICLGIILFFVVFGYIGPLIYTHVGPTIQGGLTGTQLEKPSVYHSYTHEELANQDAKSSAINPLGTDQLGRDILARLMAGVGVSIFVALLVEVFDIGLGLIVGTLAGYFGGWVDTFLARFTDVMFAFPGLLFAIIAAATLGTTFNQRFGLPGMLVLVSLAIAVTIWPLMARYIRGQTLQLKEQQFVEAARTVGSSDSRIIMRHIVPNLFSIVITAATLNVVGVIIGEAVLSLLGLGVRPPGSSLGLMISDGIGQITRNPMEVFWPSLALVILVICFSFLGDGVRDAFDPRTKD